ncbi:hypothetical protein ES703_29412 [subsurface metagenome]
MNTTLKTVLITLIVVLVIGLIGFLVYNFFIKKPGDEYPPGEFPEGEEGEFIPLEDELVPKAELKIKAISQEAVIAPFLSVDQTTLIKFSKTLSET